MQDIDTTQAQGEGTRPRRRWLSGRLLFLYAVVLALLMVALLPPLINVNRFQRRIATSIGGSLGRPVHLDRVELSLLPLPGFTLENFVVSEDPAFGSEPIIRANSVRATLRLSSLWRKRVEFSKISFTEPSVNLVHLPNGKWNLESILAQASRIEAAPTAQVKAGATPRFPYIEATGARLNLKQGLEKTPLSLTDAEFALWLPNPQEWRLRLEGRPSRTDSDVTDTGVVRVEGTLGHAASLSEVPVNLEGEWRGAPLGEASRFLMGRDAGLRGDIVLTAKVQGTVGKSEIQARLRLNDARRADFVPARPLAVDMECLGTATSMFHAFENVRCSWPPNGTKTLALAGEIPDVRRLSSATVQIGTPGIPASTLVDWLHVASDRVPADVAVTGVLAGSVAYRPGSGWDGEIVLNEAGLTHGKAEALVVGDVAVHSAAPPVAVVRVHHRAVQAQVPAGGFVLAPTLLALGGKDPAVLEGRIDRTGYSLHLTGMATTARLLALGDAVPQFGDGLAEALPTNRAAGPFRVDMVANRTWGGEQVWADASAGTGHRRR
ncbi:AsmA protein [Edaphobacter aggregans]|uniref:AsmA protein n=1 Tax=Edaphobacter aggregans TaxID=570835 RepID=A0A3R9PB31_9BACT|nr:AsmA family protein [Edaphobacter aggregans]RSL17727.1 AsmA protein [Edaphobacter aggregans]